MLLTPQKNDIGYLSSLWGQYNLAINFSLGYIDDSGFMNVTSPADWLRFGMGEHNIEVRSSCKYQIYH
jgi:hypothetical protein